MATAKPRDWSALATASLKKALTKLEGTDSFTARQQGVEAERSRAFMYRQATRLRKAFRRGRAFSDQADAEARYSALHQRERARRMTAARSMDAVREVSPMGGHWHLGPRRIHTADCLFMAGKNHSWRVLDKINPAKTHAGCGCWVGSWMPDAPHGSAKAAARWIAEIEETQDAERSRTRSEAMALTNLTNPALRQALATARYRGRLRLPPVPTIPQPQGAVSDAASSVSDFAQFVDEQLAAEEPVQERAWNPAFHPRWPKGSATGGQFRPKRGVDTNPLSLLKHKGRFARSRSAKSERMELLRGNLAAYGITLPKDISEAEAFERLAHTRSRLIKGKPAAEAVKIRRDLSETHIRRVGDLTHLATNIYAEAMEEVLAKHAPEIERWGSFYPEERDKIKALAAEYGIRDWRTVAYMASAVSPLKDWSNYKTGPLGIVRQMLADGVEFGAPSFDLRGYGHFRQAAGRAIDTFEGERDSWSPDVLGYASRSRKTRSFARNLIGDESLVTVDAHMLKLAFQDDKDPETDYHYEAASRAVVRIAEQTGVTPSTVQAVLWGYAREIKFPLVVTRKLRQQGINVGGDGPSEAERASRLRYERDLNRRRKKAGGAVGFLLKESDIEQVVREVMDDA